MKRVLYLCLGIICLTLNSCENNELGGWTPKNVTGKTLNFGMYSILFNSNTSAKIRAQVETRTYSVTYSSIKWEKTSSNNALLIVKDLVVHYGDYYDGAESLRIESGTYSFTFTSNNSGLYGGDTDYYFTDTKNSSKKEYHWSSANQYPFSIY